MPKRHRSTFGCIQEIIKGKKYRLRWMEDTPDGRRRMSETFYGTRGEARARMSEIEVACGKGGRRGGTPTLASVWERDYLPFLDALIAADKAKPRTKSTYKTIWNKHVGPRFGSVPVDQIRPGDIQEWLFGMTGSVGSTAKAVLKNVLERAQMKGHVSSNAAEGRFVMSSNSKQHSKEIYDLATLRIVDEAMRGSAIEAAYLLQAHGGLRVGESLAVRKPDVAFFPSLKGLVAVVHVGCTVDVSGKLAPTKTRKERTAYVTEPWSTRLREVVDSLDDGAFLTDDGFGSPLTVQQCRRVWGQVEMPDGVARIPMRNLRASYETYMRWELGVDGKVLQHLLGHASQSTTDKRYDRPKDASIMRETLASVDAMADRAMTA